MAHTSLLLPVLRIYPRLPITTSTITSNSIRSIASAAAPQTTTTNTKYIDAHKQASHNSNINNNNNTSFYQALATRTTPFFRSTSTYTTSSSSGNNNNNRTPFRPGFELPSYISDVRDEAIKGYERVRGLYKRGTAAYYERVSSTSYGRLARLDKPIGTRLLYLPCAWGIGLGASTPLEVVGLSALVYTGAILARGAGCTINDIFDRDVDMRVARTKKRPLASGELTIYKAIPFAAAQFIGGLGILSMLSPTAFIIGTFTLIPAVYYPIAKRVYKYPQLILALTFNTSALVGYAAAADTLAVPSLFLYASGVCWTMIYDTIYGHQDKVDDAKIPGLNSTSLTFSNNNNTRNILSTFAVAQFASLLTAGYLCDLGTPFYMGAAIAANRIYTQIYHTDLECTQACGDSFRSNAATGAIIWASILCGRIL